MLNPTNSARALQLLQQYGQLTSDELTSDVIVEIASRLGWHLDRDSVPLAAITSAMREGDASKVSDILASPTVLPKIQQIIAGSVTFQDVKRQCPLCETTATVRVTKADEARGYAVTTCTVCRGTLHVTPDGVQMV